MRPFQLYTVVNYAEYQRVRARVLKLPNHQHAGEFTNYSAIYFTGYWT